MMLNQVHIDFGRRTELNAESAESAKRCLTVDFAFGKMRLACSALEILATNGACLLHDSQNLLVCSNPFAKNVM